MNAERARTGGHFAELSSRIKLAYKNFMSFSVRERSRDASVFRIPGDQPPRKPGTCVPAGSFENSSDIR